MKKILMSLIFLLSVKLAYAQSMPFEIPTYEQFKTPDRGPVNLAIPTPSKEDYEDYVRCQQVGNQNTIKTLAFMQETFGAHLAIAAINGLTSTSSNKAPIRNATLKYVQIKFQELQLCYIPEVLQQKITALLQDEETLKALSNNPEEARKMITDSYKQALENAEEQAKKSQQKIAAFFSKFSKQQKIEAHTEWIRTLEQQFSHTQPESLEYKLLKAELEKAKAQKF